MTKKKKNVIVIRVIHEQAKRSSWTTEANITFVTWQQSWARELAARKLARWGGQAVGRESELAGWGGKG